MNYILGVFLLGTAIYCFKKFHAADRDSGLLQVLCAVMGIVSFVSAEPIHLLMGSVMTALALAASLCCYFQSAKAHKARRKKAVSISEHKKERKISSPAAVSYGKAV